MQFNLKHLLLATLPLCGIYGTLHAQVPEAPRIIAAYGAEYTESGENPPPLPPDLEPPSDGPPDFVPPPPPGYKERCEVAAPETDWWETLAAAPNDFVNTRCETEPGIGWIYDAHFPWIFTYGLDGGTWLYLFADDSTRNDFYAYSMSDGTYLWACAEWGWYYTLGENAGWGQFTVPDESYCQ